MHKSGFAQRIELDRVQKGLRLVATITHSHHFLDSVGGPEKAGVGGSIPSLATINSTNLAIAKNSQHCLPPTRADHSRASLMLANPVKQVKIVFQSK